MCNTLEKTYSFNKFCPEAIKSNKKSVYQIWLQIYLKLGSDPLELEGIIYFLPKNIKCNVIKSQLIFIKLFSFLFFFYCQSVNKI